MKRTRGLSPGERAALSPGLAAALDAAGATPRLIDGVYWGARVATVWRGRAPIVTRGDSIFWPGADEDFSRPGWERGMAILQHELQHVLEYRTGELTAANYLGNPRNWIYAYRLGPGSRWSDFGAEQRASIVEDLWLMERGLKGAADLGDARRVIPWA